MAWKTSNVPSDLSGKTYLITGTSAGLGLHVAYQLAKRGARVIGANRNLEKAQTNWDALKKEGDKLDGYSLMKLDCSSFESVKAFAKEFMEDSSIPHIDYLMLNAGVMAIPTRKESVDGHELQMATNVFGQHLLTSLVLPKVLAAPGRATIITLSSSAPLQAKAEDWDDIDSKKSYDPWRAYGMSKSAAIQMRDSLIEKLAAAGLSEKVHVLSTHPGLTSTDLKGEMGGGLQTKILNMLSMSAEYGSLSSLRTCVDDSLPDGSFVGPSSWFPLLGWSGLSGSPVVYAEYNVPVTMNKDLRQKMWDYSVQVIGAGWDAVLPAKSQ